MTYVYIFLIICSAQYAYGYHELCSNSSLKDRSCSLQLLGDDERHEDCRVHYFPTNSTKCEEMEFGPITDNAKMGDIKLEPYIWEYRAISENYTVINITFSNIKWNNMKFRFRRYGSGRNGLKNHCRNIEISSNVTVKDQSVLYYDCVWYLQDNNFVGQNYVLDFSAVGEKGVKVGQYHFTVPSSDMLSPTVSLKKWRPFIYTEIQETTYKLHISPAPASLGVKEYKVQVLRTCNKCKMDEEVLKVAYVNGSKGEATYEYSLLSKSGNYSFQVTPIHEDCKRDDIDVCKSVRSPIIIINNDAPVTVICIASVTSLIVAILFAYYITLRLIRRYWCVDYKKAPDQEKPDPPKIMVIYSPTNTIHADCVDSFVSYLRNVCYLDVMYDKDILTTEDPAIWCERTFKHANYIVNVVSPTEDIPNIYERGANSALRNIDKIQLNILRSNRGITKKHVVNVIFEHVNGEIPIETQNDRTYFLLKDWQKLIGYLSKNVAPKQILSRTDKGTRFLDDLNRAKKLLGTRDNKTTAQEKKVLL